MRRTSMLLSSFFLAASFSTPSAQAENSINIASSTCSGVLSILQGSDAGFACSGDYSFLSGSINWDSNLSFFATGNLLFNNFDITAKNVYLKAGSSVTFGGTGKLWASENITIESEPGMFENQPPTVGAITISGRSGQIVAILNDGLGAGVVTLTTGGGNITGSLSISAGVPIPGAPISPTVGGTISISGTSGGIVKLANDGGIVTLGSGGTTSLGTSSIITITSPVPEPSTYASLLVGLLLVAGASARRKAKD